MYPPNYLYEPLKNRFRFYHQLEQMDCGPSCLRMVSRFHGRKFELEYLREACQVTRGGVSLLGLKKGAEEIGFKTAAIKVTFDDLLSKVPHPCILHWRQNHFVVLVKSVKKRNWLGQKKDAVVIADPGFGLITLDRDRFLHSWETTKNGEGVALVLLPQKEFHEFEPPNPAEASNKGLMFLFKYLKPYKRFILQLFLGMLLGGLLNLSFPILTQKMVDYGIGEGNVEFIYLILLSQLFMFLGGIILEALRGWIMLHMNTRINVTIISDFLVKLMRLPIRFFDNRLMADITQRIDDHERIEHFLTSSSLNTLFSLVNFTVFSFILCYYSTSIFFTFMIGSLFAVGWILLFMKKRKSVDYSRFELSSENRNSLFEIINGMKEIKLNTCETPKRWEWEKIQAKLFTLNQRSLRLEQTQQIGVTFFNQIKNILITFIAAYLVVQGQLTLGIMLSVSYIIGQMNGPIEQLLDFFLDAQDARISLDRLGEVHNKQDELQETEVFRKELLNGSYTKMSKALQNGAVVKPFLIGNSFDEISLNNVSFRYDGAHSPWVLNKLNMSIPVGKVTAIVGASGSGKTTLMKLLLKFYHSQEGQIKLGDKNLSIIDPHTWRSDCGVVMQQGYIFSDSIAKNIALSDEAIDEERLEYACRMANILDFIKSQPLQFKTKIGNAGAGLSVGQQQRMLIARAIYKNPRFLFFDEATSALDANNEKIIMENLNNFFQGKTVLVIAHRLSTVKNADQIVVLDQGQIIETGSHEELTFQRGSYYNLVKNQLELGV